MDTGPGAVTVLLSPDEWDARRALLREPTGASLASLADGIARDLEIVMARPLYIPAEKALLTRVGGRCPGDGTLLEFDPFEPHHHRCGTCGRIHSGVEHDGFWRYWYHLWLAERAVHAAVLHRLRGDDRHAELALAILGGYADRYDAYPNVDNTLGPSRVFFSTYLESIWLLQLCIALDALEGAGAMPADAGAHVRRALVAPSRELIALYDEGLSNRQAWNVAALMAASRTLGDDTAVQRLVDAPSGLAMLIAHGCLDDGSWYEGENYHMFAHRGLWYAVNIAERAGATLSPRLTARFDAGFLTPFLTMLPDATLPSRRDSQYAIPLRQPRFAEHCELGMSRVDDPRLTGVAAVLYGAPPGTPAGDNGRLRSSADVERNLPAMQLDRADLGWRALLHARPELPAVEPSPPRSVHLAGQGIAVFRRDAGRIYAALDYGETGGGHGHPDRLNLLLMDGPARWLDDMGTGSYVDRSLHWYRSTLAHNAPLIEGRSQLRVPGRVRAYDERGGAGWIHARVEGASPGVVVDRTAVVMPDYMIDEATWRADRAVTFDLPNHAPLGDVEDAGWEDATLEGGDGLEDGFEFIESARRLSLPAGARYALRGSQEGSAMQLVITVDAPWELWRLTAPGAPGRGSHRFHLVRTRSNTGTITSVWSWAPAGVAVTFDVGCVSVRRVNGTSETHARHADGWNIALQAGTARSSIALGGLATEVGTTPADADADADAAAAGAGPDAAPASIAAREPAPALALPLVAQLGERDYRRSEASWAEAGCPVATVALAAAAGVLEFEVHVAGRESLVFVEEGQENPLDNEPAEINGDGIQVYVVCAGMAGGWTIVPVDGSHRARARRVRGWDALAVAGASWSATDGGYVIRAVVALPPGSGGNVAHVGMLVNETVPGRARRRGQLVLGGAAGEWVYLRGDRIDPAHLLAVRLPADQLIF